MPYTTAFLLEVQRYYTIVPVAGPRRVLFDTVIDGYTIPKESTVLVGLGELHIDPQFYDKPDEFIPERFLEEDGSVKPAEHLLQFGYGELFFFLLCLGIHMPE